jgi:hypothetical protein
MTALDFYVGLIGLFLLFLATTAALLGYAERRWPLLADWLDEHVGEPRAWE